MEVQVDDLLVRASRQAVQKIRRTEWYIDQEEAQQEAMIGAWQAICSCRGVPTLQYCTTRAQWAVRDYVRRTKGQEVVGGIVYQRKVDMRYASEWQSDELLIESLFSGLSECEDLVVRLRAEGYNLAEIGMRLGVCEARVSQILKAAREKQCQS